MNGNFYYQGLIMRETEDKIVMTMLVLGIRKYIPRSFCISRSRRLSEIQKLSGIYFCIPKTNIVITNYPQFLLVEFRPILESVCIFFTIYPCSTRIYSEEGSIHIWQYPIHIRQFSIHISQKGIQNICMALNENSN